MTLTSRTKSTIYRVHFELGGFSRESHRSLAAAIREMKQCKSAGDCQGIYIQAVQGGEVLPLTEAEGDMAYGPRPQH